MSNKNNKKSSVNQVKQQVKANDEKQVSSSLTAKRKIVLNSPEDYAPSSQIAKAYSACCFPNFVHQKLFHALLQALEGQDEGQIDFNKVLENAQMHRSSALQIIRHMSNFGIIEVSFNSSRVIGETRKSWAFVKIIKNLEKNKAQEAELPKSA